MIILFKCEGCGEVYENVTDCYECEKTVPEKTYLKVGDIVSVKSGFGWYDGDPAWVMNPDVNPPNNVCPNGTGNCFARCCTYMFFYVVTYIEIVKHREKIHVRTLAMNKNYTSGFTYARDHYIPVKVKSMKIPQAVIEQSKRFIGQTYDNLI